MGFAISTKSESRIIVPWEHLEYPNTTVRNSVCMSAPISILQKVTDMFVCQGVSTVSLEVHLLRTGEAKGPFGIPSVALAPLGRLLADYSVQCAESRRPHKLSIFFALRTLRAS